VQNKCPFKKKGKKEGITKKEKKYYIKARWNVLLSCQAIHFACQALKEGLQIQPQTKGKEGSLDQNT